MRLADPGLGSGTGRGLQPPQELVQASFFQTLHAEGSTGMFLHPVLLRHSGRWQCTHTPDSMEADLSVECSCFLVGKVK